MVNRLRNMEESTGSDWRPAMLVGGALALLYAVGACRTIYVGDSGELVAAAATLGIPHPSGYPLYVLLGKLWTLLLPIGSVAFRMSLFSAAAAAAACAVTVLLCREVGLNRLAAVFAGLVLGLSPSFWSQATIQRVYTLNALSLVLALWFLLRWWRQDEQKWLLAAAFAASLGAANHTFMGVAWIVMMVWAVIVAPRRVLLPKTILGIGAATAAGLLPYIYLPIRSAQNPRLDWGNPETLDSFLAVLLRHDFWNRKYFEGAADLVPIGADYMGSLVFELAWLGIGLAVIAVVARRCHRLPLSLPLAIMGVNFLTMALHGSRSDLFIWHRYYIPSYAMLAVLAAAGLEVLCQKWKPRQMAVFLLVPVILVVSGFRDFDRSRYRIAEDFSRRLLASLPPGSTLAASDDNILFVLIYLTLVEGVRPDVDLIMQGVGDANLPTLRFNPEDDPVYFTHHPNWQVPGMAIVPTGLAFRIWRDDLPVLPTAVPEGLLHGEDDPRVPKDYLTSNLVGHYHYMVGLTLEHEDWPETERAFRRARTAAHDNDVLIYNLGLIYRRAGLLGRSTAAFERAGVINPRHLASGSKPRPEERVAEGQARVAEADQLLAQIVTADPLLAALTPGTPDFHLRAADGLAAAGRMDLARGRVLCAQEIAAGLSPLGDCTDF